MSNTLKFGNGEWYGKEGTILAYNSENNNYKPLPFNFERDSVATRVNKQGLIETVGADQPRIDYSNDSNGALKLEPSRTNLAAYSEDFSQSYYPTTGSSVQGGFDSPSVYSNLGSFKLIEDTSNGRHGINHTFVGITSNTDYSFSINIKPNGRQWVYFKPFDWIGSYVWFDVLNGVVGNISNHPSFIFKNAKINKIANGFFNVSFSVNTTFPQIQIGLALTTSNDVFTNYIGDGTSGVYIYGAQFEQGSYPTSYIPTQGGVVTRLADSCTNGGNEQVINSTEGVLMVEISALESNVATNDAISIIGASSDNRLYIYRSNTDNKYGFAVFSGGSLQCNIKTDIVDFSVNAKIAAKYKLNDFALYLNGTQVATDSSGSAPIGLNSLQFNSGAGQPFFGNVKDLKLYNTALTDQELQALTTI